MNAPTHNPSIKSTLVFLTFCAVLAGIAMGTVHALNVQERQYQQDRRV